LSGSDYLETTSGPSGSAGIVDERGIYYPWTGLLPTLAGGADVSSHPWAERGRAARAVPQVIVAPAIGLLGYFAGPGVHVIDTMALGDPLLARLPASPGWRVGHYARAIPPGYIATMERCVREAFPTGRIAPPVAACVPSRPSYSNEIEPRATAMLFDTLRLVTDGPLWSQERMIAILRLNALDAGGVFPLCFPALCSIARETE
jgi:arabinofuranosyltransferase